MRMLIMEYPEDLVGKGLTGYRNLVKIKYNNLEFSSDSPPLNISKLSGFKQKK